MKFKSLRTNEATKKWIVLALLIIVALMSIFVFSKPATSAETYRATIASIDDKKAAVTGLSAAIAAASTALASVIGDATTPIANQIMELSKYLLVVTCVLVLEKALLTVMGYLSFNILIPIACALFSVNIFMKKDILKILAIKLTVFALVIVSIIPFSLKISDMIYNANSDTIEQMTAEFDETAIENETNEKTSWFKKALNALEKAAENIKDEAKKLLNNFIDAIALFIISYCIMPIIIVFVVIWLIKFLFGITISTPKIDFKSRKNSSTEKELLEV